jgi:hypothetical protein
MLQELIDRLLASEADLEAKGTAFRAAQGEYWRAVGAVTAELVQAGRTLNDVQKLAESGSGK